MYEPVLMYIFIQSKLCCNFNVSSTKLTHILNILDSLVLELQMCFDLSLKISSYPTLIG